MPEAEAKAEVADGLATAFASNIKHADDVSDRRFDNAQVVVERDLANLQLKEQRDQAAEIESALRELDMRSTEMQARWESATARYARQPA